MNDQQRNNAYTQKLSSKNNSSKSYKSIILLITISFVGLLAIQFYWTNQSIHLAHKQFEQNVRKSLHTLNREIEKQEAANFYSAHTKHRDKMHELHRRLDSLKLNIHNGIAQSIDCLIVDNGKEDKILFKQKIRIDTGNNQEEVMIEFDISDSGNIEHNIQRSIDAKSRQMEHIFRELMAEGMGPLEQRFDLTALDSLIEQSLLKNGIKTEFDYQLVKHTFFGLKQIKASENLPDLKNAYRTPILPGLMGRGKNELIISFPNKNIFIAKRVWIMLVSTIILIGILIYAFYYSITSLIKQRKIAALKNDFISNMTHELKTPITSINLACETVNDPGFNFNRESVSNYLQIISDENKRLKILVNNVLDSSFIESDHLKLNKQPNIVHTLIEEVIDRFNVILENRNGHIELSTNNTSLKLNLDKFHFSNVIFNLIDNAIKYTESEPRIQISIDSESRWANISISDNGIGISKTDQNKIFDKFHRVSQGNVHNVKGFGLGLNYVQRIIELHDGEITVESEPEKGSKFTIKLPIND